MDNGKGMFRQISEDEFQERLQHEQPMAFKVGEIIEVRGSRLRVNTIYKKKITFRLLPSKEGVR